jgi:hypothetical protein
MTIKELAQKKSQEYNDNGYSKGCYYDGFMDGVEHIIDKAVKWLYENNEEVEVAFDGTGWISNEFIIDFKHAMET